MKQIIINIFIPIAIGTIACLINISNYAQGGIVLNPDTAIDGYTNKIHYPLRRLVPYTYLREADVMYTKRVWRVIDMREKINQPMYYPLIPTNLRKNLITIIHNAVQEGPNPVKAYTTDDLAITNTLAEIAGIGVFVGTDSVEIINPDPPYDVIGKNPPEKIAFDPANVKKYLIKEDWYFDRQRSVMEPRIIAICPLMAVIDPATQEVRGYQQMYWVYFPELCLKLINEEVYNPYNFGSRITYADLFMKRQFNSMIYKVDNNYDRKIEEYAKGIDALLEAENIKDMIFKFEHDVWEQ